MPGYFDPLPSKKLDGLNLDALALWARNQRLIRSDGSIITADMVFQDDIFLKFGTGEDSSIRWLNDLNTMQIAAIGAMSIAATTTMAIEASNITVWAEDGYDIAVGSGVDPAYLYGGQVFFTASDTFTKADYPGLRAVIVECQGGGGGGAGAATTGAGQFSVGFAGHGGGYARSTVLVANLDTTEAITVGAAGAGMLGAGGGTPGSNGGDSIFDTISGEVRGVGGTLGLHNAASANGVSNNGNQPNGGTGDLVIYGEAISRFSPAFAGGVPWCGNGGRSHLGAGGVGDTGANGGAGQGYGGGGGGCANQASSGSERTGGAGAPGIVIVTLLY